MIRFRKKFKSVDFGSKKEIDFRSLGHKKFSSNIQKNIMRCNIRKPKLIDLEKSCRVLIFISKILHLPDFVNENNFSAKKYRHFLCLLSPNFMHKIRKKKIKSWESGVSDSRADGQLKRRTVRRIEGKIHLLT